MTEIERVPMTMLRFGGTGRARSRNSVSESLLTTGRKRLSRFM